MDLTQPVANTGSSHPLIIMLHGFGGDKHDWESTTDEGDGADRYHWNNRDTQWLAALVAATYPDVDPNRVAVTGGSYGGIESWLQASQPRWTFPSSQDPSLPVLSLQVAVPKYPSTDLAYSLAPNGRGGGPNLTDLYESSQGRPDSDTGDGNPIGVTKESYINGLFALGQTKGMFEPGTSDDPPFPCTYDDCEGQHSIPAWRSSSAAGDPTPDSDPLIRQIRRGLTEFRGAYYQDEGWLQQVDGRKVAVFSIQGWTDDLFPAVESFRMFKYLKRLDPRWPVEVAVADVGHSRAQNKPATWQRLNAQAFGWLQSQINRSHEQETTVTSEATVCGDGAPQHVVGRTPEALATRTLSLQYPPGTTASPLGAADPNGPATDAIVGPEVQPGEECRHSDGPAIGGYTAYSPPFTRTETYVGIGHVRVPYVWTGAVSGGLAARVFDVAPDGTELLVTRGVYRLDNDPPSGLLRLPLYGNHWRIQPGHRLRLDLTQVDTPTYRPSNLPSSLEFPGGVTLELPTR